MKTIKTLAVATMPFALSATSALAQCPDNVIPSPLDPDCSGDTGNIGYLLGRIIPFVPVIVGLLLFVMIVMGGIKIMTSGDNEEEKKKGFATIKNALLGAAIAVLAIGIIAIFEVIFGVKILYGFGIGMRKVGIKGVLKLCLLTTFAVGLLIFVQSDVDACSIYSRDDCRPGASSCSGVWDNTRCIAESYITNVPEGNFQPYYGECLSKANTDFSDSFTGYGSLGEELFTLSCYYEVGEPNPWASYGATNQTLCTCTVSTPPQTDADQLAEDIGLTDINIGGIFAGGFSINSLVQFGILLLLSVLTVVLLLLIIMNGIKYAGSGDDEQKKQGAVKGLTNALIGMAIIFGSYIILSFFFSFFGLSPFKNIIPEELNCDELSGDARSRCLEYIEGSQ